MGYKSGFILVFTHNSFDFGDKTICEVEKECKGHFVTFIYMSVPVTGKATQPLVRNGRILSAHENQLFSPVLAASAHVPILSCGYLRSSEVVCYSMPFLCFV